MAHKTPTQIEITLHIEFEDFTSTFKRKAVLKRTGVDKDGFIIYSMSMSQDLYDHLSFDKMNGYDDKNSEINRIRAIYKQETSCYGVWSVVFEYDSMEHLYYVLYSVNPYEKYEMD